MEGLTDLEKFTLLYKSFGIECTIVPKDNHQFIFIGDYDAGYGDAKSIGTFNDKFNGGYSGFYSEVEFDENGKFLRQGFLE